jgi:hypothetical protein
MTTRPEDPVWYRQWREEFYNFALCWRIPWSVRNHAAHAPARWRIPISRQKPSGRLRARRQGKRASGGISRRDEHSAGRLVKPGDHPLPDPKGRVTLLRHANNPATSRIASETRRPCFDRECAEAAKLYAIAPDERCFDLIENGVDEPINISGI